MAGGSTSSSEWIGSSGSVEARRWTECRTQTGSPILNLQPSPRGVFEPPRWWESAASDGLALTLDIICAVARRAPVSGRALSRELAIGARPKPRSIRRRLKWPRSSARCRTLQGQQARHFIRGWGSRQCRQALGANGRLDASGRRWRSSPSLLLPHVHSMVGPQHVRTRFGEQASGALKRQ